MVTARTGGRRPDHRIVYCPRKREDHSAYRSELAGLYSIATMVEAVCEVFNAQEGTVEIGCDGIGALNQGTFKSDITNPHMAQFDIIGATRQVLKRCPVKWVPKHVKDHHDNDEDAILDRRAQINIKMDLLAKAHWHREYLKGPSQSQIYCKPWSLMVQGQKVSQNICLTVEHHIVGQTAITYWDSKGWFNGHSDLIDWDSVGVAMKAAPLPRRQWIVKHTSGFCATGKMMKQWNQQDSDLCP
jgi:hypothetical protein